MARLAALVPTPRVNLTRFDAKLSFTNLAFNNIDITFK